MQVDVAEQSGLARGCLHGPFLLAAAPTSLLPRQRRPGTALRCSVSGWPSGPREGHARLVYSACFALADPIQQFSPPSPAEVRHGATVDVFVGCSAGLTGSDVLTRPVLPTRGAESGCGRVTVDVMQARLVPIPGYAQSGFNDKVWATCLLYTRKILSLTQAHEKKKKKRKKKKRMSDST